MQTLASPLNATSMQHFAKQTGVIMMGVAMMVGLVEFSEHRNSKIAITAQPAFVFANEHNGLDGSAQRRERDESAPHYIGYSAFQRTPGRTGRY